MSNTSPYLGLLLPVGTDNFNRAVYRNNLELIDQAVGSINGNLDEIEGGMTDMQTDIDTHKSRHVLGGDDAMSATDIGAAPYYRPGDTILCESLSEESSSDPNKEFRLPVSGRFRITGEIRTSNGANTADIYARVPSVHYFGTGTINGDNAASFSTNSTGYTAFSIDMSFPIGAAAKLNIIGHCSTTMYMRNIRIRGVLGTVDSITEV
jgi:hypothetical protein